MNIKRLVEHYITRIRINAGAFGIEPASVQLAPDNSHFDQTNRKIAIGMKELLELFGTCPDKPLLIFHHELYHFLSSAIQGKSFHPSDAERVEKINRSIASFSESKTQPYIDLFLFARNTIHGILDQRIVDCYISYRKREGGRTGLIRSDIDEELKLILKIIPGKMEGRDPVFIEDFKRTIFPICDAVTGIGRGLFQKKLDEYTGKVPTSIYSLKLTLLLFFELYKNRSVRDLFVHLYKRILTGEVCSNTRHGFRKKIDLIETIGGGTYSCRWVRSSLLPFRWVDTSRPNPEKKENRASIDDVGTMKFDSRGKRFTGRSIIRFKTCRLPLTEEKVPVPRRFEENIPQARDDLPRHICMIINPANEASSPEEIPLFFSQLSKKSAEIIMELKEPELQFKQSVLEIYTLHLGIINEPRFPMDESRMESGLVIIHINQLFGKHDYPEIAELILHEKQTLEKYLLAGLEEQFFYSHTNIANIRVMPKVFTDEKFFLETAGPTGRIIMLTYHQYRPEGDFRFGEMLFTSEEVKKRIEYFYVVDSKSSDIAEFEKMIKRSKE